VASQAIGTVDCDLMGASYMMASDTGFTSSC
jgi:hypothetical protein